MNILKKLGGYIAVAAFVAVTLFLMVGSYIRGFRWLQNFLSNPFSWVQIPTLVTLGMIMLMLVAWLYNKYVHAVPEQAKRPEQHQQEVEGEEQDYGG